MTTDRSASRPTTPRPPVTITLTGAAGQIGYAALFRIASGDLFGPDQPVRLRLLEIPAALTAAEGTALELSDGAFGLLESVDVFDDPNEAFTGAQVALLVGSRPRGPGMERADLLAGNAGIFSEHGRAINDAAADDVRVVVVGNPANTNALIAATHAPDVPAERFTALTRLDHLRAEAQLALATGAANREVQDVIIWGNHSASQFPDLSRASVAGKPAAEVLAEHGLGERWVREDFVPTVAQRGAEIIRVRGGSSVGSAANAMLAHVRDWFGGLEKGSWTSMAVPTDGSYGLAPGLICSLPVTCGEGRYEIVHGLDPEGFGAEAFRRSVAELEEERDAVSGMGLLGPRRPEDLMA